MLKAIHIGKRASWLLTFPLCGVIYAIASANPGAVETLYSLGVYQSIRAALSAVFGRVPFSVSEVIVISVAVIVTRRIVLTVARTFKTHGSGLINLLSYAVDLASGAGVICVLFVVMWGLNYCRLPLAIAADIDDSASSVAELRDACAALAQRAGSLRDETSSGVARDLADAEEPFRLAGSRSSAYSRAGDGFVKLVEELPSLGIESANGTRVKPVIVSKLMSYCGITGIFFPVTGEANVNSDVADAESLFVMCHELAHQAGYAREDEANFIAWLACDKNSDADFRYSGNLMAFSILANALGKADQSAYGAVMDACSDGMLTDLAGIGEYWERREGVAREASNKINDAFLKVNGQTDGVASYGRMVDLTVGYLRRGLS